MDESSAVCLRASLKVELRAGSGRHQGDWLFCKRALWIGAGLLKDFDLSILYP